MTAESRLTNFIVDLRDKARYQRVLWPILVASSLNCTRLQLLYFIYYMRIKKLFHRACALLFAVGFLLFLLFSRADQAKFRELLVVQVLLTQKQFV